MSPRRIVLLTGNPLRSNPRVVKEASSLVDAGYEVSVHGAWSGGGGCRRQTADGIRREAEVGGVEADMLLAKRGGYAFVPLLPLNTLEGKLHRLVQRAARKVLPWSKWTFGLMPLVLEKEARRLKPDLVIAHSEPALLAARELHRRKIKVGVDMEDWFSEDLSVEARRSRPVALLRRAEQELLSCAVHATCTTEAMADALAGEYGCPRPTRIYNVFPQPVLPDPVELRDRSAQSESLGGTTSRGASVRSIHWFSQTIGPGRGLEELFAAAAPLQEQFEIHLRGNLGGYQAWLDAVVPVALRSKVFVHAIVPNEELPDRIAEHDIGFAGETAVIRSRDLTATNKIFQYLQSGLAVVASDTAGQREVAALACDAVAIYPGDVVASLRGQLARLISDALSLERAKAKARQVSADLLNWEKEQPRFLASIQRGLEGGRPDAS